MAAALTSFKKSKNSKGILNVILWYNKFSG